MQATDYQKRLAHNVLSLMPARGFRYHKDLVAKLGWSDAGKLSRLLNHVGDTGRKQRWELSDIIEIGIALGFATDPFVLLRPLAEVIGAVPNGEATGTSGPVQGRTPACERDDHLAEVLPFPLTTRRAAVLSGPETGPPFDRPARITAAASVLHGQYDVGVNHGLVHRSA